MAKAKPATTGVAAIRVPIDGDLPPSEWTIHVDMRLTREQATAIRRVAAELDRRQARLHSGARVVGPNQALKWILEQLSRDMA